MNPCPVPKCESEFPTMQGLAVHVSRSHPDYDPNANDHVDLVAAAAPTDVELEFSVIFDPEEIVLLQALTFLRASDLSAIAAEAFCDLFRWAREQEGITTLVSLREQWLGELVADEESAPASETTTA